MGRRRRAAHARFDPAYHFAWVAKSLEKWPGGDVPPRPREYARDIRPELEVEIIGGKSAGTTPAPSRRARRAARRIGPGGGKMSGFLAGG